MVSEDSYPKISIVTPSYNQGQFLEETIKSVLNQNYPNLEYIVIDGGSTDNSVDIIKKYEDQLTYWVSEPDDGQADAVNKGFAQASGEILAWQNSDDIYASDVFQIVGNYFKNNPDVYMIYGDYCYIDGKSKIFSCRRLPEFKMRRFLNGIGIPPQPVVFFRREALERCGYLDTSLKHCMDLDLYIRIGRSFKVKHIDTVLGYFRIHQGSKTISLREEQFEEMKQVRDSYMKKNIINQAISWYYDSYTILRDFVHTKTGVFSFRDKFNLFSQNKYIKNIGKR